MAQAEPSDEGLQLAQRVYDRPDGADAAMRGAMVLTEEGHAPRVRQMFTYRRDTADGEVVSWIRFSAPSDIEDTGLLTQSSAVEGQDQWVFLPALNRARRIPASRKGGRFVGSDLYYEDLQDRKVREDTHRLVGREAVGEVMCEVLESVPADPENSVYRKRLSWIDPRVLLPLRVDFFETRAETPTKRLTVNRIDKVQGYWTILDSTMADLRSGHETRLSLEAIAYDQGLPERLFSRRTLEDPSVERRFRP